MELLLGLCAFFQLFLSSSCFCGLRHQRPNLDQAYTTPSGQSEEALEAPWLVNIYGNGKRCQGVVLSSWWILTAANCFLVMMPSHVELTGSSGRISTETVSQFVPHKGFSSWDKTPNNDLGLILLGQPLNLGRKDMWPACVPDTETSVNTQENCMIFERGAQGTTQETRVDDLVTSECAVHWPDTTEKWNLCVARRMSSGTDCTVPIGSPVICYNPRNENWEVMAIVTRSLHNCTAPILASQLLSHLQWLKKQGALETSFDQELEHTATPEAEPTLATNIATSQEEPTLATNIDTSQAKPTRQAYLVRHITARPTTLVHSSKEPKPSTTAHNIILLASPTLHALSHVSPTIKQFVPQTTNPTTTTSPTTTSPTTTTTSTVPSTTKQTSTVSTTQQSSSVISSTTVITSTTTQQTSTKQPSSTTTETTVTTTSRPSTSPTFRPPHVIIIPATTPRKASPVPATDVNQGAPVRFVVAGPQFPKNKGEESPSPGPSLALAAPPRLQIPIIPNLGLPVQVKLRQCEMGLAWNSNSHAYQLSKMAVLIDRKVGCGLRPGFVPKCPSCSQAEMGEFPWIVSLRLSIQHFCAGSILNPWWILTTANCVNLIKNSETLALVQAGVVDLSTPMYSVQIRQAVTHPKSLEHADLHNLGLLELEKPLEFGPLVAPVCISEKTAVIGDFRDCWLPGWTVLEGGPTVLLRYHLEILNISSCNQIDNEVSNTIFCIKAQMDAEGVCKGDVGSPLICPDPKGGAWLQLGVLSSFDEACSGPYVFSSLPHYLPWLERITKAKGHRYNLSVPWEHLSSARNLRLLREPETLVKWISPQASLPWQVLIATCENQSCGGSILSHYWVLTTAQCARELDPQGTAVFVGLTHPRGHVKGIRVAEIYPYEKISQYGPSGNSSVALLLLQNPITFGTHVTRMTFSPTVSWDSCKVMGLQMLQPGEVQTNPNAYQVKVLLPSDCAKVHPGVNPAMHCTLKDNSTQLPAGAVGEGAALLCHMEEEDMPWSQVGLVSEPFPGSQTVFLSSCINFYVDWIEETSKKARHLLQLSHGSVICRPNTWLLLLILSFLGGAELG